MNFGNKKTKFTFGKKTPSFIFGNQKIKDVKAHCYNSFIVIDTKEKLKQYVDTPCLKACEDLFDKNIETLDSGCNGENCSSCAYIVINYDGLDEKNKQTADGLVNHKTVFFYKRDPLDARQLSNTIEIIVPTSPEETIDMVEKKLKPIVQNFQPQKKIKRNFDYSELIAYQQKSYDKN